MLGGQRRMLAMLACLWGAFAAVAPCATAPELVHTNDRDFQIPFTVDPLERPRLQEVQLHYSADQGNSWRHYANNKPDADSFSFTAVSDGEYWFAVRTRDFEDRLNPPTLFGVVPGLRVVVDTAAPRAQLRGVNPVGDQLGVEWSILDSDAVLDSLRIDYRTAAVGIAEPAGRVRYRLGPGGAATFEIEWATPASGQTPATFFATFASAQAELDRRDGWTAVGLTTGAEGRTSWRPHLQGPITVRLRVWDRAGNLATEQVSMSGAMGIGPAAAPSWPTPAPLEQFQPPARPDFGAEPVRPLMNNAPSDRPAWQGRTPVPASMPRAIDTRLVNSTRFGIDYETEEVGKSGLGQVALFYTRDGQTWDYYAVDDDLVSPFAVEVGGEGVYGFRLVAQSVAGLGDPQPSPGTEPQVWVEVDLTPPLVKLYPPEPGQGTRAGTLAITWYVEDKNLVARPVALYYAEQAGGPWEPIEQNVANTGRFEWRMPDGVPFTFHVRLEAKDSAGNVANAVTDRPVIVDLVKPRLKIRGIAPLDQMP